MYDPGVIAGSMAALSAARARSPCSKDYAKDNTAVVGSPMPVLFAKTGSTKLRVAAIFTDDTFGSFFVSLREYERDFTAQEDQVILVAARAGHVAERREAGRDESD